MQLHAAHVKLQSWLRVKKIAIQIDLFNILASSQALSPAPFQAKGGFPGNVETPLPTRLHYLPHV